MNKTSVLILKGRKGTGKTTLAKCFRELYSGERCKVIDLRMDMPNTNYNIIDSHENITAFENEVESCLNNSKGTQFIIVVETIPNRFNTFLKKIKIDPVDVVDLDMTEFYNATDRRNILKVHMKMNNIHFEDDLKQSKSIDASIPISIGTSLFNDILSTDTLLGFPSMCALFCSHSDHIKLGIKYVRQPPATLVEMLDELRKQGESDDCSAIQYCLFVSVLFRYMFDDLIADSIIKHIIDFTENYDETDLLLSIIENIKSDKLFTHNSRLRFFRQCGVYASKFFEDFNPEIYAYCLAWEYIFVKMENNENRLNEFKDIVIACDSDVIGKFLHTSIDEFGNTLFHYFIIWNGKAEQTIIRTLLTQSSKGELTDTDIAKVWVSSKLDNTTKRTPLHFAVFFGRYTFCLNCTRTKTITRNQEGWFKSAWGAITKQTQKDTIRRLLQRGINNISNDVKNDSVMKIMFKTDLIPSKSDIKFGDKCEFDHIKSILE